MERLQGVSPSAYFKPKAIRQINLTRNFPSSNPVSNYGSMDTDKYLIKKTSWYVSPFEGCNANCSGDDVVDGKTFNCQYFNCYGNEQDDCPDCIYLENQMLNGDVNADLEVDNNPKNNMCFYCNGNINNTKLINKQNDDLNQCGENVKEQFVNQKSNIGIEPEVEQVVTKQPTELNEPIEPEPPTDVVVNEPSVENNSTNKFNSHFKCCTVTKEDLKVEDQTEVINDKSQDGDVQNVQNVQRMDSGGSKADGVFKQFKSYDEKTKFIKHIFATASPMTSFENNFTKLGGWTFESDLVNFNDESPEEKAEKEKEEKEKIESVEEVVQQVINLSHLERAMQLQDEEMQLRTQVTESLTKALLDMPLDDYVRVIKAVLDEVTTVSHI